MKYEGKRFEIREYDNFPHRSRKDDVIKIFADLETASYESIWLGSRARFGERYYVVDVPHTEVEATPELELRWTKMKMLCGII